MRRSIQRAARTTPAVMRIRMPNLRRMRTVMLMIIITIMGMLIVTTAIITSMALAAITSITTTITTITVIPMLMTKGTSAPVENSSTADAQVDPAALYRLMTWLSPSFPVGSFAFSSGIEWAVEANDIRDATTLRDWIAVMLSDGAGLCDSIFFVHAHRAASARDFAALASVAELAAAYVTSRERHLETTAQGKAFVDATKAAWNAPGLDDALANISGAIAYPVAVGVVSALHGLPLPPSLHAFLHGVISNWISAGVRLIPLGQTDGQHTLAALESDAGRCAERALTGSLDDLGGATFRADIASMRHETQYTRLFRS